MAGQRTPPNVPPRRNKGLMTGLNKGNQALISPSGGSSLTGHDSSLSSRSDFFRCDRSSNSWYALGAMCYWNTRCWTTTYGRWMFLGGNRFFCTYVHKCSRWNYGNVKFVCTFFTWILIYQGFFWSYWLNYTCWSSAAPLSSSKNNNFESPSWAAPPVVQDGYLDALVNDSQSLVQLLWCQAHARASGSKLLLLDIN